MQDRVKVEGEEIVLVGTAHVSEESAEEVDSVIREESPDAVAVELDRKRYDSLKDRKGWEETNLSEALEEGKGSLLLVNVLLSIHQRRMGENLEAKPGADMLAAIEAAETAGKPVSLIDRDISETLGSALGSLSIREKLRLSSEILLSLFGTETVTEEDVEELKDRESLTAVVDELGDTYPGIKKAFLDERDSYMAQRLLEMDADKVVAVLGAAHLEGVKQELENPSNNTTALASKRRRVPVKKVLEYGIPALIVGMLAYIFLFIGFEAGSRAFAVWFLLNGVLAAAGALASRSHPLTAAVAFVTAPFTSVNPLLPAGLVAAYAENRFNPPTVKDLESIGDVREIQELWSNTALNLLLIFMMVNLGSSIASYIGAGYLAQFIV